MTRKWDEAERKESNKELQRKLWESIQAQNNGQENIRNVKYSDWRVDFEIHYQELCDCPRCHRFKRSWT
jgi:hypothetical protein